MTTLLAIIGVTAFTILIFYSGISGYYYYRPSKILLTGVFFIFFSFTYKMVITIINNNYKIIDIMPLIDMSTAALGGNLIAAAFIIRAQIEHNKTRKDKNEELNSCKDRLEQAYKVLTLQSQRENSGIDTEPSLMPGILSEIQKIKTEIKKLEELIHDFNLL